MKALIVCHAGAGIGLGHLSRSLVIANALCVRFGADVRFLIQGDSLQREDLNVFSHRFVPLDQDLAGHMLAQGAVDLILLDLQPQLVPQTLGSAIGKLRARGIKIVAIDGLLAYRPQLDLIFMPSFQFKPPLDLKEGAPIVFGWDCFLLDAKWGQSPWKPGRRVLALTGGSDATQLGATWPELLTQSLPTDVELHWVTGPFAGKPRWPATSRVKIVEHLAPVGLGPIMQRINYAVTVFGVSFFELLYLGVPTVTFSPYSGKNAAELKAIAASGVALVASDEREATERLAELLSHDELAAQLSLRAQVTLGRSGTHRLCSEIARLITN